MHRRLACMLGCAAVARAGAARAELGGRVIDRASGAPVAGARVATHGGPPTATDAEGGFVLAAPDASPLTLTAAHPGHYHASIDVTGPRTDLVLALDRLPADDPAAGFAPPVACASCHAEQYADWQGSPMARAGANTWVLDLYDGSGTPGGAGGFVYARDSVHAAANPASECASCHQPLRWAGAVGTALATVAGGGAAVTHGVSCDLCHRIASIDTSRPSFPGIWPGVVEVIRSTAPVQLGVLGDVAFQADAMRPGLQPQLPAEICAACHQDRNDPDDDGDFEEADGVISEPTYLEWRASRYADPTSPEFATCAGCHMPVRDELTAACIVDGMAPRPAGQVRSHRIEGTTAAYLEHAIALDASVAVEDREVAVVVTVRNDRTGHHVPTGVTVRNVILRVEAVDAAGVPLVPTGGPLIEPLGGVGDPERGYWAGLPGTLYAKVPAGADGAAPVFYTDATSLAEDDRLAAGAADTTEYRFAAPADGGPVHVIARVIYRRAYRALVDVKGWTTDGHGRPLEDLEAPHFGHLMASVERTVDVPAPAAGCGCAAGSGEDAALLAVAVGLGGLRRRRGRGGGPT